MTTAEFEKSVTDWMQHRPPPKIQVGSTPTCVYQPMLELLRYLRANGFKTFIVSGGGIDFMRPWAEQHLRHSPEQVVGSSGKPEVRSPRRHADHRQAPRTRTSSTTKRANPSASSATSAADPIVAFGNSDGDYRDARVDHRRRRARVRPDRPSHRRRPRSTPTTASRRRPARQSGSTTPRRRAGRSST